MLLFFVKVQVCWTVLEHEAGPKIKPELRQRQGWFC